MNKERKSPNRLQSTQTVLQKNNKRLEASDRKGTSRYSLVSMSRGSQKSTFRGLSKKKVVIETQPVP